jgi:hypothetical protein
MKRSRSDSLSVFFLRFEFAPPLCDLLRDLLAPAAEERADGDAKGGLVSKPGLKGRLAVPGFVARHLHARRGAEEIGKPRLSEMGVAAISAEVVIKWPSVYVCHGSTKNRRLAGSSVESGYVSGTSDERKDRREIQRAYFCTQQKAHDRNQTYTYIII